MLEILRKLILVLVGMAVVQSCASGDPDAELAGKVELAQRLGCAVLGSDGQACTTPDEMAGTCYGGICCLCVDVRLKRCMSCDDRNPCTADSCIDGQQCANQPLKDGLSCGGGICIGGGCCTGCVDKAGECRFNGSGEPEFCGVSGRACEVCTDDDNPCTDDVCLPEGKCAHPPKENGVQCETDKDVCNGTSRCQEGFCRDGAPLNCANNNPCKTMHCDPELGCVPENNTDACEDGDPCTINDRCSEGVCKGGETTTCNDNEFCTDDSCDPREGCIHRAKLANTPCDDRNACSTTSACNNDGECIGTSGKSCADADPCTINGCNVGTQECNFSTLEPVNTPCIPANDKCVLNAKCDADGECAGGVRKDCNDNNPCTADSCDPQTGECGTTDLDGDECSDDSACTENDHCQAGLCVGEDVECTASDDCHEPGKCDEATGLCADLRKRDGSECNAATGKCTNGSCIPNPVTGEGGAGGEASEGGAPAGGTPATDAGEAGEAALGGTSTSGGGRGGQVSSSGTGASDAGDEGDDDGERGPPFVRKRGGCSTSPSGGYPDAFALVLLAGVIALAGRKSSRKRARTCAAAGARP